jgi:hypothetical protein
VSVSVKFYSFGGGGLPRVEIRILPDYWGYICGARSCITCLISNLGVWLTIFGKSVSKTKTYFILTEELKSDILSKCGVYFSPVS